MTERVSVTERSRKTSCQKRGTDTAGKSTSSSSTSSLTGKREEAGEDGLTAAVALLRSTSTSAPLQPPPLSSTQPQRAPTSQEETSPSMAGASGQVKTPRAGTPGPSHARAGSPESWLASAFPPGSYDARVPAFSQKLLFYLKTLGGTPSDLHPRSFISAIMGVHFGLPAKEIQELTGVPEITVLRWKERLQWEGVRLINKKSGQTPDEVHERTRASMRLVRDSSGAQNKTPR